MRRFFFTLGFLSGLGLVLGVFCFFVHITVDWHESRNEIHRIGNIASHIIMVKEATGEWPSRVDGDETDFWGQRYQVIRETASVCALVSKGPNERLDTNARTLINRKKGGDDIVILIESQTEEQGFVRQVLR